MGDHVRVGELDIWTEQVGEVPDVLLIGGLGDTVESWQFQLDGLADRYRLIAFDNRGAGRTAMPEGPVSVEAMADDAAGSCGRSRFPPPTSPASRGAAASPRSSPYGTPSSCAASSCRARSRRWTPTFARWPFSSAGWSRSPRASARSSRHSSLRSTRRGRTTTAPWSKSSMRCSPSRTSRPPRTCSALSTPSSSTTRRIACRTSPPRRSCSPAAATSRSPGALPRRRRAHPRRPLRGHGGGGPPALPGGAGRMERPRRRLLARGRGPRLRSPALSERSACDTVSVTS